MSEFKDHFSSVADTYARYRPSYPEALFEFLAKISARHDSAWDCGTGNGQAALGLAEYFKRVYATDPSATQLKNAVQREGIYYSVAPAERSGLEDASVDLVTVAQAIHWFDHEKFYQEVRRVCRPNSLIAIWCYELACISPEIDRVVQNYYEHTVGKFWAPERKWVESGYKNLPFPFSAAETTTLEIRVNWDLEELMGYLRSWSATEKMVNTIGEGSFLAVKETLQSVWGPVERKYTVVWPLSLRTGNVNA